MTPTTVTLVQDSFSEVAPIADAAAEIFYDHLFDTQPQLRPMFPQDMAGQKSKLMKTLAFAVASLGDADTLLPALRDLGARHGGYGVAPEHYAAVGASLIHTLRQGLGPAFTEEVREAWLEVYATVAAAMQEGAAA
ncbi:Bacterial hemoglobin [Pseudoruegeria aquimaris]|uniref:Bacterial hemoglobin n=1 Tax=Pseudoruegeria aquimaris TaxID=393663 RepID=A0A1Y5SH99_9RHOB|nr:globin family protein [Pseudoruegeria aquimaris]SLN37650.1 Bacterial hemoglobin [Pseudoruegeria aquimaris]